MIEEWREGVEEGGQKKMLEVNISIRMAREMKSK